MERLQKVISQAGLASRRHAEVLITSGKVTVNGVVVTELGTKVNPKDKVSVNGKVIANEKNVYVLINKPKGVICTMEDPQGRRKISDLVADIPQRIYPVGRLDYNTEGLLLMTNDGALTHSLLHPSRKIYKTYITKVHGLPSEEKIDLLRAGIKLTDGVTAPAIIQILERDREKNLTSLEVTIHEGKNRQIRRMFEAIGFPVKQLKRITFAGLTLAGLKRGQHRFLTDEELAALKKYSQ